MTDDTLGTAGFGDAPTHRDDARRAVIDAARYDGMTCARGAFEARRTNFEPEPRARPGDIIRAVVLSLRSSGDMVAWYRVAPIGALRGDWGHPTPCEPGEVALPEDEFGVADLFPAVEALPGGGHRTTDN